MKKSYVLFLIVSFCLLMASPSVGNALLPSPFEEVTCEASSSAWVDNVSPTSFDLNWSAAAGAANYEVEVWVNDISIFLTITAATSVSVVLPAPLQAGDEVRYSITTHCENGRNSESLIGVWSIIITEDVVMTSPNSNGPSCDACPFITEPLEHSEHLFLIYDCACRNQYPISWKEKCFLNKAALNVMSCDSPMNYFSKPSRNFYPNPFDNQLQATFEIIEGGEVNLSILDFSGKEILSVIKDEYYSSGEISVSMDGSDWEKGIYYYVFTVGQERRIGRLVRM